MSATAGQYAFVIQTHDTLHRSWSWISAYGTPGSAAIGRGVEDDAPGTPQEFGRARFDAYLDHLVADAPGAVDYFLLEDDDDTEWRILVWDVPATDYHLRSSVPPAGDRARLGYALALAVEGGEPHATSTWPGADVRDRLRAKRSAWEATRRAGRPTALEGP